MRQIQAVLFDMDGLIFDTETVIKQCWQQAAEELGFPISEQLYSQFIGVQDPVCEQMLEQAFGSEFCIDTFRKQREHKIGAVRQNGGMDLKPGFIQLMADLAKHNIRTALVTSSPRSDVEQNFGHMAELGQFDTLITRESVTKSKPDPEGYLLACEQLDVAPQACLVLEDSNNGMRAGTRAGCQAIMVPDMLPPEDDVRQDALAIIDSLSDVMGFVK